MNVVPRVRRRSLIALTAFAVAASMFALQHPSAAGSTVQLKVMTWNIWYGGDEVDLDRYGWCYNVQGCPETLDVIIEGIRASDADVVGLEEPTGNTCVIGEMLGWYCSDRLGIVSRYPLVDPAGANGVYLYIELSPGRFVAMMNVHLPSDSYGPYLVRDGEPKSAVLALEHSLRMPAIQRQLAALPALQDAGVPTFLTGDFNSPSHLDWTAAVAEVRPEVRYPVVWPVSKALADAGFRDSYRNVYPDPIAKPGFTWTPPGTLESDPAGEVNDRIDWVFVSGDATAEASQILGEPGGPDVDIELDPYPTDHRGVVSTFDVRPADAPDFTAVNTPRAFVGEPLDVRFHGSGASDERVRIVPAGAGPGQAIATRSTGGDRDGTLGFSTDAWQPGDYEAILTRGSTVRSRAAFWLYRAGTPPTVWTGKTVYEVGEPIDVHWKAAPGARWDWLGAFRAGAGATADPLVEGCTAGYCGNLYYLVYEYTQASIEGTTTFDAGSFPGYSTWPLGRGKYRIRLLFDDGYKLLAVSNRFKIVADTG